MEHLKQTAIVTYGKYDESMKLEIDHIIPYSLARTEDEVVKLSHYTNTQFLTPNDNVTKFNKVLVNGKEITDVAEKIAIMRAFIDTTTTQKRLESL